MTNRFLAHQFQTFLLTADIYAHRSMDANIPRIVLRATSSEDFLEVANEPQGHTNSVIKELIMGISSHEFAALLPPSKHAEYSDATRIFKALYSQFIDYYNTKTLDRVMFIVIGQHIRVPLLTADEVSKFIRSPEYLPFIDDELEGVTMVYKLGNLVKNIDTFMITALDKVKVTRFVLPLIDYLLKANCKLVSTWSSVLTTRLPCLYPYIGEHANYQSHDGTSLMMLAVEANDLPFASVLMENGYDITLVDIKGRTAEDCILNNETSDEFRQLLC